MPDGAPIFSIENLIRAIRAGRFRVTDHADEEAASDRLTLGAVLDSITEGEIIESYPTDRPYPSCLVLGRTLEGSAIHSVWAYNGATGWAVLVTVYRPDPNRWVDWRTRKKP
jgi:hypothetical protein